MKKLFIYTISIFLSISLHGDNKIDSNTFKNILKPIIGTKSYSIDSRIKLKVPNFADNSLQVPIFIDASKIKKVKRMIIFADYNPIPIIADMKISHMYPIIATNIKVAHETPLRAVVLDDKGKWHVNSAIIKSAGGGCDVSSLASKNKEFLEKLGQTKGKSFDKKDRKRIKTSIFHPMETGFVFGTTEFYINKIVIQQKDKILSEIKTTSVISENPRFIFELPKNIKNLTIHFMDNEGNDFELNL